MGKTHELVMDDRASNMEVTAKKMRNIHSNHQEAAEKIKPISKVLRRA